MKIDNIDASRLGYGKIYLPFSVDIPDEQYWRYTETDQNYAILVEAVLKFKEICEKQKESIENKKQIINNLYGSRNVNAIPCTIDVSDNVYNYVTTGSARARAINDFVTVWKDEPLSEYERSYNDKTNSENSSKTNETTAFTSGEISW